MTPEEFVSAVESEVRRSAIEGVLISVTKPPGRRVSVAERARADWVNSLNADETVFLQSVIKDAVDHAVFGFLCAIDGVRALDSSGANGEFELVYQSDRRHVVSPTDGEFLHDLYRSLIEPGME